ncbi:hypothetical protein BC834DRAFT_1042725 [Gloeopeniophorella convolvens]|nr:hypothetical protein BC834DRAFT_1042725 [Gloeopeniophorella convolvens]
MTTLCAGCEAPFSHRGYRKHLQLTTRVECIKVRNELGVPPLGPAGHPVPADQPEAHLIEEDRNEREGEEFAPQRFRGDYFGTEYIEADFGYVDEPLAHQPPPGVGDEDVEMYDAYDEDDFVNEDGYPSSEGDELDDHVPEPDWEPLVHPPREATPAPVPDLDPATDEYHGRLLTQTELKAFNAQMFLPPHVVHFSSGRAGAPMQQQELSQYEELRKQFDATSPGNIYAPFASEMDWEIARWAKQRGPSSRALTDLLAIPGVSERLGISFKNARELNNTIDSQLPGRPPFRREQIVVAGVAFDIYYRDIIECIKALFGDPKFQPYLAFSPERHYTDATCSERQFHDMHTGEWWWSVQEEVEREKPGATIIPIVLSTDKTQLTLFRDKTAYPVYMTIGNISKDIRRKPSFCASVLLAYLPATRLEHVKKGPHRTRMIANLYHAAMRCIVRPTIV